MKLLLDHCLPRRFKRSFPDHAPRTAGDMGWEDLRNGRLLAAGALAGFEAFLTIDKNLRHQQNLSTLPIAVLVIMAQTNRLSDLLPYVPFIRETIKNLVPKQLLEIHLPLQRAE